MNTQDEDEQKRKLKSFSPIPYNPKSYDSPLPRIALHSGPSNPASNSIAILCTSDACSELSSPRGRVI